MLKLFTKFFLLTVLCLTFANSYSQEDATISADEIQYWIGEGNSEVIFIVNWNNPNIALAWGYRFNGESVTTKEVMDAVANDDNRFDYSASNGMVTDITYNEGDTHLSLSGMYWLFLVNGVMANFGYETQEVVNGDYIKWGDESCATEVGQWVYVWTQTVTPATNIFGIAENSSVSASLYPNPATTGTYLNLVGNGENVSITIYDIQGRAIKSDIINIDGETIYFIDTEVFTNGIYFISINTSNYSDTMKLIVK
ncbi:MAG: T9SS type A sorting domain-containing protein [Candidatus Limimorpha sp.]